MRAYKVGTTGRVWEHGSMLYFRGQMLELCDYRTLPQPGQCSTVLFGYRDARDVYRQVAVKLTRIENTK